MSRTRSGRKAWETRVEFDAGVGAVAAAMSEKKWKYDSQATKAMVIERIDNATGLKRVITFSLAYGELAYQENLAFSNNSEDGFSDMLCDIFFDGSIVWTRRATFRLWNPVH